jgi:N-hydroxyarylamine O-acetyltransferase
VRLFDMPLFTFTEQPCHPVDYVAPNHFSATHPLSIFTQNVIVQRWDADDSQIGVVNLQLTVRRPDGSTEVTELEPADIGPLLRDRFSIAMTDDDMATVAAACARHATRA